MPDAFLKERRSKPTRKYPNGSPFVVPAAASTIKRFASYLAAEGLADRLGSSVLRSVKRGKVRQPFSDPEADGRSMGPRTSAQLPARSASSVWAADSASTSFATRTSPGSTSYAASSPSDRKPRSSDGAARCHSIPKWSWATNFMRAPGASLSSSNGKAAGNAGRWSSDTATASRCATAWRYRIRLQPSHKTAFGQPPFAPVSRLSAIG